MSVFRLGNEVRKRREEEDRKLMEKDAEMEANTRQKSRQSCTEATTHRGGKVPGGRSKTAGGGEQQAREAQEGRCMEEEEKRKGEN